MQRRNWHRNAAIALWRFGLLVGSRTHRDEGPAGPDWQSNIGRGGLRINERIRDIWRRRWLKLRRTEAHTEEQ